MPSVSVTVAEQIEALRKIAGDAAVALIREEPDQTIRTIVDGWSRKFDPKRALSLGFKPDASFEEIIRIYQADEMGK